MIALIIFWGSSFVIVKIALNEGMTPVSIATFRFLVAGLLFSVVLLFRTKRRNGYKHIDVKDLPKVLFLALSGVTFFFTAQYTGIQMAGAAIAAILVCFLAPILITILSTKILKEKLSRKQFLGIMMAAIGTLTVITGGTLSLQFDESARTSFFFGSLILFSTPFLWTAYSIYGKKIVENYNPLLIVTYVTVLGAICLIPFSLFENSLQQVFILSINSWLAILYLSITCSVIGYYIWFYVIEQVGAAITSTFLFAEPLITVLFAVMFVGEEVTFSLLMGGILIFTGVYLVTRK
jgi:drug/metabolite transporter (DMT)-like permease